MIKDIAKIRPKVVALTILLALPRCYEREIKGMSERGDYGIPAGLVKRPSEG